MKKIKKYIIDFFTIFIISFLTNIFVSAIWNYIKYKQCGMFNLDTGFIISFIIAIILVFNRK